MATYKYDEHLSFVLPYNWEYITNVDDEGTVSHSIGIDKFINDDGETAYNYTVSVSKAELDEVSSAEALCEDLCSKSTEDLIRQRLSADLPSLVMVLHAPPIELFGQKY